MSAKVSITGCAGYSDDRVYDSVKEAVGRLGGMGRFAKKGERILLKPNLVAGKPPETAVTTHPAVVKAVIRLVKEAGATPLVGDSPGLGGARKAAEKSGILAACLEEGAEFLEFRDAETVENPGGHTFKRLEIAKDALGADGIINLPKLKTHAQMLLTLGVKNIFGCVPGKRKAQWHLAAGVDGLAFASMILDLYLFVRPRLTVMDSIVAMEGNGPGNGDPRALGFVFASADAVAMDAVIAEALGARLEDLHTLRAARARGIKEAELKNIEVVGKTLDEIRVKDFRFPPVVSLNFAARLPYFLDRALRKALTSRPGIDAARCALCNICVEVCPPGVMRNSGSILIDYDGCIRCFCCQELCPHGAISVRQGWLKRLLSGNTAKK